MNGPVIALLTDFGTRDPYVAAVKGVLLSRCDATLLDLSHELSPYDVFAAADFLATSLRFFPRSANDQRMIILAVVDPGVGSARRLLAVEDEGRFFLAPDNGLLTMLLTPAAVIHELLTDGTAAGRTFDGRDRLAPAAARIANGEPLEALGPRVPIESIVRLSYRHPRYGERESEGTIVSIDRFGNCITDLAANALEALRPWSLMVGSNRVEVLERTYAAGSNTAPFLIVGSRGTLEISVREQSAAALLHLEVGQNVRIERMK